MRMIDADALIKEHKYRDDCFEWRKLPQEGEKQNG